MRKNFSKIISHPLFTGSLIMLIGSNLTNFINYSYHLLMGRMLSVTLYGELAALISLVGLVAILPSSLGLVIVKAVSSAKTDPERDGLIIYLKQKIIIISLMFFVIILFIAPQIAAFLKIHNSFLLVLVSVVVALSFLTTFNRSVLQGELRFSQSVVSVLLENLTKLILGVTLIYFGYAVFGATFALVVAGLVAFALSNPRIQKSTTGTISQKTKREMLLYSPPVLLYSLSMTALYTTDLILVKHFFSGDEAGIYAAITTLGKIILYASGPISVVMFPLIARRYSQNQKSLEIVGLSLLMTLIIGFVLVSLYALFPKTIIELLYDVRYTTYKELLFLAGINMLAYSLSSLLLNYFLSIARTSVVVIPVIGAILQVVLIYLYHQSLATVLLISLGVTSLLLISLLVYFIRVQSKINLSYNPSL